MIAFNELNNLNYKKTNHEKDNFRIGNVIHCPARFPQVVINEIMYAPSDASNEWFELYNTGNNAVNLQNWKWKDATQSVRTITTQNISLPANTYVIICEDSVKLKSQFPNMNRNVIQTAWSALNNTGDNVILIDQSNSRIDSVSYQTAWGGNSGGYSLERINPLGAPNSSSNWGTSTDILQATPGRQNSITPKPFDLMLKSFTISPLFPTKGETLSLSLKIRNSGLNIANDFSLTVFGDINFDSIPQADEQLASQSYYSLNPSDSIVYDFSIQNIDSGLKQYIAKVNYVQDNDTLNNKSVKKIFVSSSSGSGGVVINEIMYDPLSNQSEWIELYNASGQTVNIRNWKYKETSSSVNLSASDLFLNPGDYFVLAHDSTVFISFPQLMSLSGHQFIKFSTAISLNNSGENITITDSLNNIIDAVNYDPNWHNLNLSDTKGISLERINPALGSNNKSNWSSCADNKGGTPGLQNSIFVQSISSASSVSINPNPFSPDGDGFEDIALINFKLNVRFSQMRVRVFDIKGRLVRTLSNNQLTGSEGTIIFNGFDNENQKLRVGIYILLIEAVDDTGGTVDRVKEPIVVAAKL